MCLSQLHILLAITWRTRAAEVVDQIVAGPAVLAWIRAAVVYVKLAVLSLEALGAVAGVGADQVFARGPVLAGRRLALVDLLLAVAARVAVLAVAAVAVADVLARAVLAQVFTGRHCNHTDNQIRQEF